MSLLNDNILSDPVDVLFDINVCAGHDMKATGNDEFIMWLCIVLQHAFPGWELTVGAYACFWYGVPEVPARMMTIRIETIGHGVYQLKIIDKRFALQYWGIDTMIYDTFLRSSRPEPTDMTF